MDESLPVSRKLFRRAISHGGSVTMDYSADEIMTVSAARMLRNGAVCFVGIGLPSKAANLARLTHAPEIVLIYESGPIGAKPSVLPLSIGDGDLNDSGHNCINERDFYLLAAGRTNRRRLPGRGAN